jgi:predicted small secreted protein
MKKLTLLSLAALVLVTSILGCNAARGVGKDMSDTGAHIQNIGK